MITQLVRTLYPFGASRRVLRGPLRGMRFIVAPGMGMTYAMGSDGNNLAWLARHVCRGATVYDIGANRGQMALFFSRMVGPDGSVAAFEPVPSLYDTLVANIRLNRLANVFAFPLAVAAATGEAHFCFSERWPTQGKMAECEPAHDNPLAARLTVQTVSLDEFVRQARTRPPELLKVDVEGGAGLVFRGAEWILETYAPAVYVELHGPEEQAAVRDCLLARGYRAMTLDGIPVRDPTAEWRTPLWCTRA